MKIGVASTDGISISQHFGRSQYFIVFEVSGSELSSHEVRDNTYTAHAKGLCQEEHHHQDQPHSHADIIAALHDCQVMLCGGMGWRAADELQAHGIHPVIVDAALTPENAVREYLSGKIASNTTFCRCHE